MTWSLAIASIALCIAVIRILRRVLGCSATKASQCTRKEPALVALQHSSSDERERQLIRPPVDKDEGCFRHFALPSHEHLEVAVHPPRGLHYSNAADPFEFETDYCTGTYMVCTRPTSSKAEASGGLKYGDYFAGKRRLWELRVQLKFKCSPPPGDAFFGLQTEHYVPMNAATKGVLNTIVGAVRRAVGGSLYHSTGDDPQSVTGELEKPHCVFPFWAWDQIIVTPEGEEPPRLDDLNFPSLGFKRAQGMREYAREVAEFTGNLAIGPTYSFAFWGCSRFIDVMNWKVVGIPLVTPLDFDKLCGSPPVHVILYSLLPNSNAANDDRRHLDSRKAVWFHCTLWSSERRPSRSRIEALAGKGCGLRVKAVPARSSGNARRSCLQPLIDFFPFWTKDDDDV